MTTHFEGKIHLLLYRENKTYHSRTPTLSVSKQHSAYTSSCYNKQNIPFPVSRESYHGSLHPFSFFGFSKYHLCIILIISPRYRRLDQVQKPQFTPTESDSLDLASNKRAFCMFSGDACFPSGMTMTHLQPHHRPTLFISPHTWVLVISHLHLNLHNFLINHNYLALTQLDFFFSSASWAKFFLLH